MQGKLIMVSTPIGNLGDITERALEALRNADAVVVEDTRVTGKLLMHYQINNHLIRCDDNVVARLTPMLIERIEAGETIAFCSDAGTPSVSDPGAYLVNAAREVGIEIEVVPGASAVLTAYVASGIIAKSFFFGAFLPRKAGERAKLLESLHMLDAALIFYESPHRVVASLKSVQEVFPLRRVVLARELTKLHEEVIRGTAAELIADIESRADKLKGECVIIVGPPTADERADDVSDERVRERALELLRGGLSRSSVAKQLASEFGLPKNPLYDLVHKLRV